MALSVRIGLVLALLAAAIIFISQSALAKANGGDRPGWGYGDKNHNHTGPPGLSVRP